MTPEARDRRLRDLGAVFVDRVVLFVDGREIRPDTAEYIAPPPQKPEDTYPPRAQFRLRGRMPADATTLRWLYGLVIDPYQISVRRADGISTAEWIEGSNWSGVINLGGPFRRTTTLGGIRSSFGRGFTQILPRGGDHLLFVLGLFLLSIELRPIAIQLAAFSAGCLLTLALGAAGVVSAPPQAIASLIALSIAYVAIENLMTSAVTLWRLALVFAFGLVHGLKFAAAWSGQEAAGVAPAAALPWFALGIAAAMLTAVGLAASVVAWYRHQPWYHRRIVVPASLCIAAVGVYWTVIRALA
jgi:hypothetical protein